MANLVIRPKPNRLSAVESLSKCRGLAGFDFIKTILSFFTTGRKSRVCVAKVGKWKSITTPIAPTHGRSSKAASHLWMECEARGEIITQNRRKNMHCIVFRWFHFSPRAKREMRSLNAYYYDPALLRDYYYYFLSFAMLYTKAFFPIASNPCGCDGQNIFFFILLLTFLESYYILGRMSEYGWPPLPHCTTKSYQ